jgi:MFS transporter, DHA3 family, macrolide efflux protein
MSTIAARPEKSLTRFMLLWSGQIISVVGSGLTTFALGVKIYQETGSATQFTLSLLFGFLPGFLVAPVVGALVDRWDKRKTMILSDTGGALVALILALLALSNSLQTWHIYLATAAGSIIVTFQWAAYNSLIPIMVPKEHFDRANGIVQSTQGISLIISPLLAGTLLSFIGLSGVILLDVATYSIAMLTALLVKVAEAPARNAASRSLLQDVREGWLYIRERPTLLDTMLIFTAFNLFAGIAAALIQPLILSIGSVSVLGILMAVGGSGMVVGGVAMSIWGGPKNRMQGTLIFMFAGGIFLLIHGLTASPWLIGGVAFAFLFTLPVINGSIFTIWQLKVAPEMRGRFYARPDGRPIVVAGGFSGGGPARRLRF